MMEKVDCITNVEALIEALEESDPNEYPTILKTLEIPPKAFESYETWKEDGYTRNSIYRSKKFELILLCWRPGDKTPIHSHDGQKCWVYQVRSSITEERYRKNDNDSPEQIYKQILSEGELTYMEDRMGYHVLANRSAERASILHLYMQPIDQCQYFCEEEGEFVEKELEYDSVVN